MPGIQQVVDWSQITRALQVFKSPQRRSPPRAVPSANVELSEEEIVGLIKNIKKMDDNMQQFLKSHMEELESLDPEKVQRIKKKIIDNRR